MTERKNIPVVRLKDDRIILRLGAEEYELEVIDGYSDEASHLAKTIMNRIQEVLAKRRRNLMKEFAKKCLR